VYSLGSLAGLTIFKALIVVLVFFLVAKTAEDSDDLMLFLFLGLCFLSIRDGLRERPQLFTYLFAAVYLRLLRAPLKRWLFLIPLLQLFWVNMHGAAACVGIGLVGIYALFSYNLNLKTKTNLLAATIAVSFINPHTYRIFTYLYTMFVNHFNMLILEYQSPRLSLWFFPYFLLLALTLISFLYTSRRRVSDIMIVIMAATASLAAIRNIPLFAILVTPIAADNFTRSRVWFPSLPKTNFASLCAGIVFLLVFWGGGKKTDVPGIYNFGFGDRHKCRYAAAFIKQTGLQGTMFNDYDFGGYLIGKLYPEQKVFVDGRLIEYGREMIEDAFYYWKPAVWQKLDGKYNFTVAVIPQEPYYAAQYLDSLKDWVLVYWDDGALVYVKDVPENKKIISTFGYRILKPNSPWQGYLKDMPPEAVVREIERACYFAPYSGRAQQIKHYVDSWVQQPLRFE